MQDDRRLVTVLSGFLGAGKSTRLNRMLNNRDRWQGLVFISVEIDWPVLKAKLDAGLIPPVMAGGREPVPSGLPDASLGWQRTEDAT